MEIEKKLQRLILIKIIKVSKILYYSRILFNSYPFIFELKLWFWEYSVDIHD